MSSVARPRGPLPARVYWTRRLLVLAMAFALVFGLAHLLGGSSDGRSGPAGTASQVAADSTSSAPTTTQGPPGTTTTGPAVTKPSRKASKKLPALPQPDGPCSDDEVVVKPVLSSPKAGSPVTIGLEFYSNDSPACSFVVSPATVVVKLTSGKDFIWSSQDCRRAIPNASVVARRTVPGRVNVLWNGQRSDRDCTRTAGWVGIGWYHAIAAALGGEPTDVQFELRRNPSRTITRTASPTQQPTQKPTRKPSTKPTKKPSKSPTGAVEPNG